MSKKDVETENGCNTIRATYTWNTDPTNEDAQMQQNGETTKQATGKFEVTPKTTQNIKTTYTWR